MTGGPARTDDRGPDPDGAAPLANISMALGVAASVGGVFFLLLTIGTASESVGRSAEGTNDDASRLSGLVGCVGALLAVVAVAGVALGLAALSRRTTARRTALLGTALSTCWLVAGVLWWSLRS